MLQSTFTTTAANEPPLESEQYLLNLSPGDKVLALYPKVIGRGVFAVNAIHLVAMTKSGVRLGVAKIVF